MSSVLFDNCPLNDQKCKVLSEFCARAESEGFYSQLFTGSVATVTFKAALRHELESGHLPELLWRAPYARTWTLLWTFSELSQKMSWVSPRDEKQQEGLQNIQAKTFRPSPGCSANFPAGVNAPDSDNLLLCSSYANGKLWQMSAPNFPEMFLGSRLKTAMVKYFTLGDIRKEEICLINHLSKSTVTYWNVYSIRCIGHYRESSSKSKDNETNFSCAHWPHHLPSGKQSG